MGIVPSSSTRIKHLVSVDNKKFNGMQEVRDILLKSLARQLKTRDISCKEVSSRVRSIVEKQSLSHPHRLESN